MANSEESGFGSGTTTEMTEMRLAKLSMDARRLLQYLCCIRPFERERLLVNLNWPTKEWPKLKDVDAAVAELMAAGFVKERLLAGLVKERLLIDDSLAEVVRSEVPESVKQEIAREWNLFWH
jgi:hypothetical protein